MVIDFNNIVNNVLQEGKRDEALSMFLPLFQKRGIDISISQLKQALLAKFVNEGSMNNLSLASNYYLLGVARYYFNGDLTNNTRLGMLYNVKDKFKQDVCERLNALILILRNSYIDSVGTQWEQPEDFGTLTIEKLFRKYGSKINKALGIGIEPKKEEEPIVDNDTSAGKNYTYEIMYSYEDCQQFNKATRPGAWCITYGQQHYNAYVRRLGIHYVVFKRNDYESVPRKTGQGFPCDDYGNSLICVLQSNNSPEPIYITSRWNHGGYDVPHCEADHAYNKEQFLQIIGDDGSVLQRCYDQWNTNKPKKQSVEKSALVQEKFSAIRRFKYAQMLLNGGNRDIESMFDSYYLCSGNQKNGLFVVKVQENDNWYVTLMDRNQIYYDKCLFKMGSNFFPNLEKVDDLLLLNHGYGSLKRYFYDCKRHRFLEVEGRTCFKYSSGKYNIQDSDFFGVAMSGNEFAIFSKHTGKSLQYKGQSWFESVKVFGGEAIMGVKYGHDISLKKIDSDTILDLTCDSAAQTHCYFNTTTKSFLREDFAHGEDGWEADKMVDICGYTCLVWEKVARTENTTYKDYKGNEVPYVKKLYVHKYQNLKDGRYVTLNGNTEFKKIESEGDVIAYELLDEGLVHFFNAKTLKPIMLNGQEFLGQGNNTYDWLGLCHNSQSSYIVDLHTNYQRTDDKVCLYDTTKDKFLHDKNGEVLFKADFKSGMGYIYSSTHEGMRTSYTFQQLKDITYSVEDIVKAFGEQKEQIKKQFDNYFDRIQNVIK